MNVKIISIAALALCLVACKDSSSPNGALESAYQSLLKNDTQSFIKLLGGEALQKYSSVAAQEALKKDLSAYPDMKLASPKLTSTEAIAHMQDRETYSVKVLNKGQTIFSGKSVCIAKKQWVWNNPSCHGQPHPINPNPVHPGDHWNNPPAMDCGPGQAQLDVQRDCKIVQFNKI